LTQRYEHWQDDDDDGDAEEEDFWSWGTTIHDCIDLAVDPAPPT